MLKICIIHITHQLNYHLNTLTFVFIFPDVDRIWRWDH